MKRKVFSVLSSTEEPSYLKFIIKDLKDQIDGFQNKVNEFITEKNNFKKFIDKIEKQLSSFRKSQKTFVGNQIATNVLQQILNFLRKRNKKLSKKKSLKQANTLKQKMPKFIKKSLNKLEKSNFFKENDNKIQNYVTENFSSFTKFKLNSPYEYFSSLYNKYLVEKPLLLSKLNKNFYFYMDKLKKINQLNNQIIKAESNIQINKKNIDLLKEKIKLYKE